MKHTEFSVAPNVREDEEELPFYQKPGFKLAAVLGIVSVILLISVGVAFSMSGGNNEPLQQTDPHMSDGKNEPLQTDPHGGYEPVTPVQDPNNPPAQDDKPSEVVDPSVVDPSNTTPDQPTPSPSVQEPELVPGFIQGTKLESFYVSVRSYCRRHHAAVLFAAVSVAILVVAGVVYAQHLEEERILQEHLLELERQRELERQQELLSSQLQNLVTEEGWNWGFIVRLVIAAYGASFILTIPLIFGDYLQNWDSLFKNSAAKRAAAYFVLFISLHSILAGIALVLFLMIVLIRQLIEHMPRSSFPRFVSLMVIGFFHILALIISIPLSVMAGVLHLLGDGEIIMRAYKGFWIESWRLYPISYNF